MQYDDLIYIGICGGAKIFGKHFIGVNPNITFFDFMEGVSLKYEFNCNPTMVTPNVSPTMFQITTGCGIAVYLHCGEYMASSFCCAKKSKFIKQWKEFGKVNTDSLMKFATHYLDTWYVFLDPEDYERWYYRLDGCCWYRGCYSCMNVPDTEREGSDV